MRTTPLFAVLLFFAAAPAAADVVVLTSGRRVVGGVHRDAGDRVAVNPHFSRDSGMVFDVEEFPRGQVKEVIREDPLFVEYLIRSNRIAAGDAGARVALAKWCEENKLDEAAEVELLAALRIDPAHEEALKEFGRSKFPKVARGNPVFDPAARAAIEEYLAVADPEERRAAYGRLTREHQVSLPREALDRMRRSLAQPTGLAKDRPLTLRSADHAGVYTIFVPKEYDPRRAWPLVIGLHGGGRGGKDGDAVVGNGDSAKNFYVTEAAARGYIVVCPTALAAPWADARNDPFLRAVIEEVELLYHVDLNRVYLTGHSMGGFGCWHYGVKWAEEFAAISPMAGGGPGVVDRLVDTNTPVFIYHGADDGVVGPDSDRVAARRLAGTGHDYVYTELTGVGHGFPESIRTYLFDFFDARRLAPVKGRRAGPPSPLVRSSFLGKASKDEIRYLGDPAEFAPGGGGGAADWESLVENLKLGGGRAAEAAAKLGELKPPKAVKALVDLLRHPSTSVEVKGHAARALGLIGDPAAHRALVALLDSDDPELVAGAAAAIGRIAAPDAATALLAGCGRVAQVLKSKCLEGTKIHYSDWDRWLSAMAALLDGIAMVKPSGMAADVDATVVRGVLAAGYDVVYTARAGQDPAVPRRRLALAAIAAVAAIGDPGRDAALASIEGACPGDAAVAAACREARGG